ncbi:MAG: hypothetical protein JXR94_04655, partial [Candidatus Hydrogenedentes bacterium]|nr:hypothetical protein [Candidatus Hydrogenedentota bacterium]
AGHERAIALTLLRAFELSLTTVSKRWDIHPEMELSQAPGAHEFRYAVYAHAGPWHRADVFAEAERLTLPLQPAQAGPHPGDLPKRHSFLAIEPAGLVLSALKQSEDGSALIVRLFNPTDKRIDGIVRCFTRIRSAELVSLEELPLRQLSPKGRTVPLRVERKKIVTLRLRLR